MSEVREYERVVFDIYFSGIVAMSHCHPGAGIWRDDEGKYRTIPKPDIQDCANLALEMIKVRRRMLFNEYS